VVRDKALPRRAVRKTRREADARGARSRGCGAVGSRGAIVVEGVRRLAVYQDLAYARRYLDRLKPITEADARASAGGKLLRETGATSRCACRSKTSFVSPRPRSRRSLPRIESEIGAKDQPYVVTEFLKPASRTVPGAPPRLARAIIAYAEKRGCSARSISAWK